MITMEPINLVTGLPGAGKTLFGIDLLRKCQAEGLHCFNFNVTDLDVELAEPWPGPIERWQELPEKSVLIVDEAHSVFPRRSTNASTPSHIAALAEIRHKGLRLILIDQDPSTLDLFVKRRVGAHFHLTNRTGHNMARVYSNRGCVDNPRSAGAWSVGESDLWRYPKELFDRYRSASLHIKRKRVPKMVWVLVAGLVLIVGGLWGAYSTFSFGTDEPVTDGAQGVAAATGGGVLASSGQGIADSVFGPAGQPRYMTPDEWLHAHLPLVEAVPWSAPIFAGRPPTTTPDLLCVVVGEVDSWQSDCRCFTEQVTRLQVERQVCLNAARYGVYNPYRTTAPASMMSMPTVQPPTTGPGAVASAIPAPGPGAGVSAGIGQHVGARR